MSAEECRAENCKAKHPHKRFCVHGHDTFGAGRGAQAQCRGCVNERWATDSKHRALQVIKRARRRIRHRREVTIEQIKETVSELLADD